MQSMSPRMRGNLNNAQELELKAQLCLMIAAKIEETDDIQGTSDRIPHCMMIKELRKAAKFQFSKEDYLREEGPTFNALKWNLMCITPFHFLHSLTSMGLLYDDDKVQTENLSHFDSELTIEKVRNSSFNYLDQWLKKSWCVLYKDSRPFRPSVVAFSCILAARREIGIIPILSEHLKEMALLEECYTEEVFEEIG